MFRMLREEVPPSSFEKYHYCNPEKESNPVRTALDTVICRYGLPLTSESRHGSDRRVASFKCGIFFGR